MKHLFRVRQFFLILRNFINTVVFVLAILIANAATAERSPLLDLRKPKPGPTKLVPVPLSAFKSVPQKGHTGLIKSLAYSADSRFILTGSIDNTARLWDARTNILIRVFQAEGNVAQVAFVPDEKRIVVQTEQGQLHVFDLVTGTRLRSIPTKRSIFTRIRTFTDGRRVLVSAENTDIRIVDIDTGQTLTQFNECPSDKYPRTNIDLSNDNRLIITACVSGTVQVREIETGKRIASYEPKVRAEHGIAFLNDGKHALLFYTRGVSWETKNNGIEIWDYRNGKIVAAYKHDKDLMDFTLSKDGKSIALLIDASLSIGEVEVRNLWTFDRIDYFKDGIGNHPGILRLSPDGKTLAAPGDLSAVALFDLTSKQHISNLSSEDAGGVRKLARRPNRWEVASVSGDGNVYLFDIANVSLVKTFDANVEYVTSLDLSPDGRFLATTDLTNPNNFKDKPFVGTRIWNVSTGDQLYKKVQNLHLIRATYFTPDGKQLFLGDRKQILVKDTASWKTQLTIPHEGDPYSISISKDQTTVAISSDVTEDGLFDMRTGKRITPFPLERTQYAYFAGDDSRLLSITDSGEVELWDPRRNSRIRTYISYKTNKERLVHGSVELSQDGTKFVGVSRSQTVDVWDVDSGALLSSLALPTGGAAQAYFLPNPAYVAIADTNGILQVWNLNTKTNMSFVADGNDWIVYTDDGYFDGSRRGGRLVAAVNGLSSFRIDQVAIRNNRPDIILQRMGLGNKDTILLYESLYQRRLKKLGLTETDLDQTFVKAPVVSISSVRESDHVAAVSFEARDDDTELARYNIYVNDVPIFGATGKPLSGHVQRITETTQLASGNNKIEVGVLNHQGFESMRPSVNIANSSKSTSDLYYLAFGVSKYQNDLLNLKYAAKDVDDLATSLSKNKKGFGRVFLRVYTNESVSLKSVREAKEFLAPAKVNDTVVLFVAGHGVFAPDSTHDYYFLTYQSDLNHIQDTAVPFEQLEELLQGIAPRKKLFLLDSCYSGEESKEASTELFTDGLSRGLVSRGIRRKVLDDAGIPREKAVGWDRNRFIYNDLFRRSGAIVLSSSRGSELSYEKDELQNGLFTEHVLRALSSNQADTNGDRKLSTDELRSYVAKTVSAASGGLQNPVVDRDNLEVEFSLPLQ
jgi:WD40 repeat protein